MTAGAAQSRNVLLEICCGSAADAWEAQKGGADRIELCSAMSLGGLTPSMGAIAECKRRLKLPVMVMVRPRSGGFCYSPADFAVMERDVQAAVEQGADGVVFGVLRKDGRIDVERCSRLRALAGKAQTVFHRAFDLTPDPFQALDSLIRLGVTRVLTSGQKPRAADALATIRSLVERAPGGIEILAGGGIRKDNVRRVVRETGCTQVHLSAFKTLTDPSARKAANLRFGDRQSPPEDEYSLVDRKLVRAIATELRRL
jgi:copper homeostasis protein